MANPIDVACPQCQKKIKASDELRGKKVRCKNCTHVFAIPAAEAPKAAAAPAKVKKDDDDDAGAYGLTADEKAAVPRCPHCAGELESEDAVLCLHCGYNTRTRTRVGTKRTVDITAADRTSWLMPGFIAVGAIFFLIGFDLFLYLKFPKMMEGSDFDFIAAPGIRLWLVIFSVAVMLLLGKFALNRLVFNPNPPEQERG